MPGRPDEPDDQPGQQRIAEQGEQGRRLEHTLAALGVPEAGTAQQLVGKDASEGRHQEMAQAVEDPKEAVIEVGTQQPEEEPQHQEDLEQAKEEGNQPDENFALVRSTLGGRFKDLELLRDAGDLRIPRGNLALLGLYAARRPGTAPLRDSRGGGAWSGRLTA